jgi:hypothetical protein
MNLAPSEEATSHRLRQPVLGTVHLQCQSTATVTTMVMEAAATARVPAERTAKSKSSNSSSNNNNSNKSSSRRNSSRRISSNSKVCSLRLSTRHRRRRLWRPLPPRSTLRAPRSPRPIPRTSQSRRVLEISPSRTSSGTRLRLRSTINRALQNG